MAFTLIVKAISLEAANIRIDALYADSASAYSYAQAFYYPVAGTQTGASMLNDLKASGTVQKNNLLAVGSVQSFVGTVITI